MRRDGFGALWKSMMRSALGVVVGGVVLMSACGVATAADNPGPADLKALQEMAPPEGVQRMAPTHVREKAMEEAAKSFGARGGLSFRTAEIGRVLQKRGGSLSQVFDFGRLLIAAPSGLFIQPPVIVEGRDGLEFADGGQAAGVTDLAYRIVEDAKIVPAPRLWGAYLEREWPEVAPPPREVFPQSSDEREKWRQWVAEGWAAGVLQADEIFQEDLDRLVRDYVGMVKFRVLLAQGMVSMPFANEENRGITGGGHEMRVGDRAVRITGPAELVPRGDLWRPADR